MALPVLLRLPVLPRPRPLLPLPLTLPLTLPAVLVLVALPRGFRGRPQTPPPNYGTASVPPAPRRPRWKQGTPCIFASLTKSQVQLTPRACMRGRSVRTDPDARETDAAGGP